VELSELARFHSKQPENIHDAVELERTAVRIRNTVAANLRPDVRNPEVEQRPRQGQWSISESAAVDKRHVESGREPEAALPQRAIFDPGNTDVRFECLRHFPRVQVEQIVCSVHRAVHEVYQRFGVRAFRLPRPHIVDLLLVHG